MSALISKHLAVVTKAVDAASPAPIIALYYAASWCPDCVASKPYVSEIFKTQADGEKLFDLVYISSDNDSDQMKGEMEEGWDCIEFEKQDDRSDLKKFFGVCAHKEMKALGITSEQRKGGIPTLVLINKANSGVLSSDAIPDIMGDRKVDDPLAHWRSLLSKDL
uniref:Thioredoxin-like fold domain-containing protein n=1 Tax=Pseudo-nitzschia australis TaxID=44445 RepID=A0A7S4A8V4_9STRA|mmetsp:Transcript_1554/g.3429  ORF Transcript_1554/g.3429 Transcript_1554/m.3429 type:complete len:164 (+) Transcript_1554:189-680(+)